MIRAGFRQLLRLVGLYAVVEISLLGMPCWDQWSLRKLSTYHFFTITRLASQSGYLTSAIDLAPSNRLTSSFTAFSRSGPTFCLFYLMGLEVGSTFSSWVVILGYIPSMSLIDHANVETFWRRNSSISTLISSANSVHMPMHRSRLSSSKHICVMRSHFWLADARLWARSSSNSRICRVDFVLSFFSLTKHVLDTPLITTDGVISV